MEQNGKVLPFATSGGFTAIPNAVCKYYVRHPKFTPTVERVYRYLLQRYNSEYNYAWPSYSAIMRESNIGSRSTVSGALEALEQLELIRRVSRENENGWDNNCYVFMPPIEDEALFYAKYGDQLAKKYTKRQPPSDFEW
jgi:hypothetical protein